MAEDSIDQIEVRDDLKIERAGLFEQFLKSHMDARLALAIKTLDDRIADCAEWIRRKDKSAEVAANSIVQLRKTLPKIDRL